MSYETELVNKQFQLNVVISINGDFFGDYQVDSDTTDIIGTGTGLLSQNIGLIKKASFPSVTFDIKTINTTTQTFSFELLDKNEIISNLIANDNTALMQKEVICYLGFIDPGTPFDFQDYKYVSRTNIKKITKTTNGYSFDATELTDQLMKPVFNIVSSLNVAITNVSTSLDLVDATNFPSSGRLKIEDEFLQYTTKVGNTLSGLSRGDLSSIASNHDAGVEVSFVYATSAINPISLLLQLLISPGGGGTYDVLPDGIGLNQNDVDVTQFESIRTNFFNTDQFDFYIYGIDKAIDFIQNELLKALNCRIFSKNGKVSLAILDQVNLSFSAPEINEDSIIGNPSWSISSDNIVNIVTVNYDYSEGERKYSRSVTVYDANSITNYGQKPTLIYNFKGVRASLNGLTLANNRANRILARLSNPSAKIKVKAQFDSSNYNFGDPINIVHRYIPKQGGGLGIADQVEIVSRSVDLDKGTVDYDTAYTSYSNLRIGLIAPTHVITSVVSQSIFNISNASLYEVGYALRLWDENNGGYFADPVNTIASIVGNQITMTSPWVTTLTTSCRIKFADYDNSSTIQKSKWAFASPNSGFFADGKKAYQVVF